MPDDIDAAPHVWPLGFDDLDNGLGPAGRESKVRPDFPTIIGPAVCDQPATLPERLDEGTHSIDDARTLESLDVAPPAGEERIGRERDRPLRRSHLAGCDRYRR